MKRILPLFISIVLLLLTACSVQIYDLQPIIVGTDTPVPTRVEQQAFVGITPTASPRTATATPPIHIAPTEISSIVAVNIYEIAMVDGGIGWGIGKIPGSQDQIVLRTEDGANNWKNVTPPQVIYDNAGASSEVVGCFRDANHAWVLFYGTEPNASVSQITVWYTSDGGQQWNAALLPSAGYSMQIFEDPKINFLDNQTGWLFARIGRADNREYVGVFTTYDGGENWSAMVTSNSGNLSSLGRKNGVVFRDTLEGWLSCENTANEPDMVLWHTFDGGNSWYKQQFPAPWGINIPNNLLTDASISCSLSVPKFVDVTYQYAWAVLKCSGGSLAEPVSILYWSYDRLSSWKTVRLPYAEGNLTFYGTEYGWYSIATEPGSDYSYEILFTEDGGDNWRTASSMVWESKLQFITPSIGFGIAMYNGMPWLVKSSNSGFSWDQLSPMVVP